VNTPEPPLTIKKPTPSWGWQKSGSPGFGFEAPNERFAEPDRQAERTVTRMKTFFTIPILPTCLIPLSEFAATCLGTKNIVLSKNNSIFSISLSPLDDRPTRPLNISASCNPEQRLGWQQQRAVRLKAPTMTTDWAVTEEELSCPIFRKCSRS
jgi:hypothetical protein